MKVGSVSVRQDCRQKWNFWLFVVLITCHKMLCYVTLTTASEMDGTVGMTIVTLWEYVYENFWDRCVSVISYRGNKNLDNINGWSERCTRQDIQLKFYKMLLARSLQIVRTSHKNCIVIGIIHQIQSLGVLSLVNMNILEWSSKYWEMHIATVCRLYL
jgi:hypothetical protein